jgi:hypothetical protein
MKTLLLPLAFWMSAAAGAQAQNPIAPAGPLVAGHFYWGVNGHIDQGGTYLSASIAQQIADIQYIFGTAPNKVTYRLMTADGQGTTFNSMVRQIQSAGIIPIVGADTYPNWFGFANELAAYNSCYSIMQQDIANMPMVQLWEIGNEWDLQSPMVDQWNAAGGWSAAMLPATWRNLASWPIVRGCTAGAVAAFRDNAGPNSQVIGGSMAMGTGLGIALWQDLASYRRPGGGAARNLQWDWTALHFYNDQGDGNHEGDITNDFTDGNRLAELNGLAPIIFTEFGSGDSGDPANDTAAPNEIIRLMAMMATNRLGSVSQVPIIGGSVYQLYYDDNNWGLYSSPGVLKPQGAAVKAWVAAIPLP